MPVTPGVTAKMPIAQGVTAKIANVTLIDMGKPKEVNYPSLSGDVGFILGFDGVAGGFIKAGVNVINFFEGEPQLTQADIDYNMKNSSNFNTNYNAGQAIGALGAVASFAGGSGSPQVAYSTPNGTIVTGGEVVVAPAGISFANATEGTNNNTKEDSKSIEDILDGTTETTNGAGIARNFEKSGGYAQALKDFESLNPLNVKNIQTTYGEGKVGTLNNGTTVVVRPGSKTGGSTLEITVSNSKIYKIRY